MTKREEKGNSYKGANNGREEAEARKTTKGSEEDKCLRQTFKEKKRNVKSLDEEEQN